jgi:hypothetical protein
MKTVLPAPIIAILIIYIPCQKSAFAGSKISLCWVKNQPLLGQKSAFAGSKISLCWVKNQPLLGQKSTFAGSKRKTRNEMPLHKKENNHWW